MSNTEKNIIDNFLNDDESLWSNSKNFPYIPSNASVIKHYEKHLSNDKHSKAWKDKERVIVHNNNNYVYSGNSAIGKQVIGENIIDPYNLYEADVFAAVNSDNSNDIIYIQSPYLSWSKNSDILSSDLAYSDPDNPDALNPIIQDTVYMEEKGKSQWVDYKGSKAYKLKIIEDLPYIDLDGNYQKKE